MHGRAVMKAVMATEVTRRDDNGDKRQSIERNINFFLECSLAPSFLTHPFYHTEFPASRSTLLSDLSMSSHFARWKVWLQLVLRANQHVGSSDRKMTNRAIWSKMLHWHPPRWSPLTGSHPSWSSLLHLGFFLVHLYGVVESN